MADPSRAGLRERFRKDVQQAILDAAERVVGRLGIGGTSMNAVATEAGVAVGTLYNHFEDRETLLGRLVLRHREELAGALAGAMARTRTLKFVDRAQAFVEATIELFDRRRGFVRAALDSELWRTYADGVQDPSAAPRVRSQLESFALEIVTEGAKSGALGAQAPERLAAYLSGMLRGVLLVRARAEHAACSAEEEASALVAMFLAGAGTPNAVRALKRKGVAK